MFPTLMSLVGPNNRTFWYVAAVVPAGVSVVCHSLVTAYLSPPAPEWLILAALTLFTGSFTVKVPEQAARLSVSETFVFTSALLFGPAAGTLIAVLDALVMSFWLKRSKLTASRVLFNVAAPAIAIWTSAHSFFLLSGLEPGGIQSSKLAQAVIPLFVFALLYFLMNTWLVAGAVRTERPEPVLSIWIHNFAGLSINYFVGGSIAVLLVAYSPRIDVAALGIIVPILLISYITFQTSLGRLEDATKHVAQLNDLYLSTVETLAMAVDAKDQITHGHIRRVQVYATELARNMGVSDERQLKAIEAAALLHDMGKLAIPEHILNKPGKLTSGEFEKMKRHADIGADLLSSIPFPYPVVPIVRHHHENWDGTGYPHRIAGTDIPLGARILAVVDCFDALTSDRPYRPRLPKEAAFDILRERRGSMYDPLVVDSFLAVFDAIAPAAVRAGQEARSLVPSTASTYEKVSALDEIRAGSTEAAALADARRVMGTASSTVDALNSLASILRQITPATIVALYEYDPQRDVLRCLEAIGDTHRLIVGLEITNGERATGWSVANKVAIMNSAATLDLGNVADIHVPQLRATLTTPVTASGTTMGALSLYSSIDSPFVARDQYIAEEIARLLGEYMQRGTRSPGSLVAFRDPGRTPHVRK